MIAEAIVKLGHPRIVYKVVRPGPRVEEGWHSILATGRADVEYHIGQVSNAPYNCARNGYHLLAFDTLDYARSFEYVYRGAILICLAWKMVDEPKALTPNGWAANMARTGLVPSEAIKTVWPIGTVMCKKLMPIAEVSGVRQTLGQSY